MHENINEDAPSVLSLPYEVRVISDNVELCENNKSKFSNNLDNGVDINQLAPSIVTDVLIEQLQNIKKLSINVFIYSSPKISTSTYSYTSSTPRPFKKHKSPIEIITAADSNSNNRLLIADQCTPFYRIIQSVVSFKVTILHRQTSDDNIINYVRKQTSMTDDGCEIYLMVEFAIETTIVKSDDLSMSAAIHSAIYANSDTMTQTYSRKIPLPNCIDITTLQSAVSKHQLFANYINSIITDTNNSFSPPSALAGDDNVYSANSDDDYYMVLDLKGVVTVTLPYLQNKSTIAPFSNNIDKNNNNNSLNLQMYCGKCNHMLSALDSPLTATRPLSTGLLDNWMDEFICCSEAPTHALCSSDVTPLSGTALVGSAIIALHPTQIDFDTVTLLPKDASSLHLLDVYIGDAGLMSASIDIASVQSTNSQRTQNMGKRSSNPSEKQSKDSVWRKRGRTNAEAAHTVSCRQCGESLGIARSQECVDPKCHRPPSALLRRSSPSLVTAVATNINNINNEEEEEEEDDDEISSTSMSSSAGASTSSHSIQAFRLADIRFPIHTIRIRNSSCSSSSNNSGNNNNDNNNCSSSDSNSNNDSSNSIVREMNIENVVSQTLLHFQSIYSLSTFALFVSHMPDVTASTATGDTSGDTPYTQPSFAPPSLPVSSSSSSAQDAVNDDQNHHILFIRLLSSAYSISLPSSSSSSAAAATTENEDDQYIQPTLVNALKVSFQYAPLSTILQTKQLIWPSVAKIPLSADEFSIVKNVLQTRAWWWLKMMTPSSSSSSSSVTTSKPTENSANNTRSNMINTNNNITSDKSTYSTQSMNTGTIDSIDVNVAVNTNKATSSVFRHENISVLYL